MIVKVKHVTEIPLVDEYGPTGELVKLRPEGDCRGFPEDRHDDSLLTSLRLDARRTPKELQELTNTIRDHLRGDASLRSSARSGFGRWKKYNEEIWPLALFLRPFVGRDGVYCTPTLSDKLDHDAVVDMPCGERFLIEITSSKDGHEDSLRNKVLDQVGRVCLSGSVKVVGNKNSSTHFVHVENATKTRGPALKQLQRTLLDRIAKKSAKKYGRSHVLVVTFDDYSLTQDDIDGLTNDTKSEIDLSAGTFAGVYLLGCSSGTRVALLPVLQFD